MKRAKVTAEQLVASAWAAALAAPVVVAEVPPGWHTCREISEALGMARSTTGALLGRAVAEGRCEKQNFRITSGQVTRPMPHYRLK